MNRLIRGLPPEPERKPSPKHPNADAGARSSRALAEPPDMNDWIRAKVYGGSPELWARERLSQE